MNHTYTVQMNLNRTVHSIYQTIHERYAHLQNLKWEIDDDHTEVVVLDGEKVVARIINDAR